jgi:hypothetical protein
MSTFTKNKGKQINDFGLLKADDMKYANLASGVAQSIVVPNNPGMGESASSSRNFFLALFKPQSGKTIYWDDKATAAVPTGTFASTTSELILPGDGRYVIGGQTLSFITSDANAVIQVCFYYDTTN